jgi:hypothetical protein
LIASVVGTATRVGKGCHYLYDGLRVSDYSRLEPRDNPNSESQAVAAQLDLGPD